MPQQRQRTKVELKVVPKDERPIFALPIIDVVDSRGELCKKYADLIWREIEIGKIAGILEGLYEMAYSNGVKSNTRIFDKLNQ